MEDVWEKGLRTSEVLIKNLDALLPLHHGVVSDLWASGEMVEIEKDATCHLQMLPF